MITPAYVRMMAQYNGWENDQMIAVLDTVLETDMRADRGAFFGSLFGTMNHLLWGDTIWMSRFAPDAVAAPQGGIPTSVDQTASYADWKKQRRLMDHSIVSWAGAISEADLASELAWYSGALERDFVAKLSLCTVHFFNHQTHHRGQIHQMLTSMGLAAPVSDVFAMPEGV